MDWVSLVWISAMHVGAVAAPFFFTWSALGVAVFLHWMTLSIGICLGYHRFLSHRSMKLRKPVEFFTTLCGVLSGEGTPLEWSANHRLHHQRSDQPGDPHSPHKHGDDGEHAWWSHLLWLFIQRTRADRNLLYREIRAGTGRAADDAVLRVGVRPDRVRQRHRPVPVGRLADAALGVVRPQ